MLTLDPRSSALILIDLQEGILGTPLAPRSGGEVLATGRALAERFRNAGATVVLVRVDWASNFADAPPSNVDSPMQLPPGGLTERPGGTRPEGGIVRALATRARSDKARDARPAAI